MPFSQGSRTRISYIKEATFGTTPAGNFKGLPLATANFQLTKELVPGTDLLGDRMQRHSRHGNRAVSGDITFDFRDGVYDDLLEGLLFSTWDTTPVIPNPDILKVGQTFTSFSIEDYAADIDQARLFTGCAVSSGNFSIRPNQMVTTTLNFVGKDHTISATEKTVTPAALNLPFDSFSGAIQVGNNVAGLTSIANVTGIDFTIDNGIAATYVVGSPTTPQMEYGLMSVTGTISAYFEDVSLINRFINETESAISVSVNNPTGAAEYKFVFPRVKFNGANVPLSSPTSRIIEIPFEALYDSTSATTVYINRPGT